MASTIRTFPAHKRQTSADGVTTNNSPTVTSASASFTVDDIGRTIEGTNIPAGAKIAVRNSSTSVDMDVNATADGTGITLTITSALTFGSTEGTVLYGMNLRSVASNSANSYVKLRKDSVSGSVIYQDNWTASVDHSQSFLPQGIAVRGQIYTEFGSTWVGHCYIEYG